MAAEITVDFDADEFIVTFPYDPILVMIIKGAPARKFNGKSKTWHLPITRQNVRFLQESEFKHAHSSNDARAVLDNYDDAPVETPFPHWYRFPVGVQPREWQEPVLNKAWMKKEFGLFWEMRLGKTFVTVSLACAYHQSSDIAQVLVICPNSIKGGQVWQREFNKWGTGNFEIREHNTRNVRWSNRRGHMKVMVASVEGLSQGKSYKQLEQFVNEAPTLVVVDESSRIKNFKATRTDRCVDIGKLAHRRMILTGTPITQGIQDLYSQFAFLNWKILGFNSYYAFKARYCREQEFTIKKGPQAGKSFTKITGYANVPELLERVAEYTDTLRVKDVRNLPSDYDVRMIPPSAEQTQVTKQLKEDMLAIFEGEELEVQNTLERMTRYQQIAGGFFPRFVGEENGKKIFESIPLKKNPKLDELKAIVEDLPNDSKIIIWCRFRPEISLICNHLRSAYGDGSVVEYHGGVADEDRATATAAFHPDTEDPEVRFFVGNPATGGMGLELSTADYSIYFSNSFSYEDRTQSESRMKHMEKEATCMYIDLYVNLPIDHAISNAQAIKGSVAAYVSDKLRNGEVEELI